MATLTGLSDDLVGHIVQYLEPRDFYNTKTVLAYGRMSRRDDYNILYWWWHPPSVSRAVSAGCPSLIRWIARHAAMESPELIAAVAAVAPADAGAQRAMFDACRRRWPEALDRLLMAWSEFGLTRMFRWHVEHAPASATEDVIDSVYAHNRWLPLSVVFHYAPRTFVRWAFGTYTHVADASFIRNLRLIMYHLSTGDQMVMANVLQRYHEWIWSHKLESPGALDAITALHSLDIAGHAVVPFQPERYVAPALQSANPDYLEYLLVRGLPATPDVIRHTHDVDKLKLLAAAQFVQKYQNIMVMLFVLITALVCNMLMYTAPKVKIESVTEKTYNERVTRIPRAQPN